MSTEQQDPFRSVEETGEQLAISGRSVTRKIEDGELTAYKFGRLVTIRQSEIDDYIERSRQTARVVPVTKPRHRRRQAVPA